MYVCEYLPDDSPTARNANAVSVEVEVERGAERHRLGYEDVQFLPDLASGFWRDFEVPGSLWARVVREANLQISGGPGFDELSHWSPIMLSDRAFRQFRRYDEILSLRPRYEGEPWRDAWSSEGAVDVAEMISHSHNLPRVSMTDADGDVLGSVVFSRNSFIAALPPRTLGVRVTYVPTTNEEIAARDLAEASLAELGDRADIELCIWWRCYAGRESQTTDAISANGKIIRLIRTTAIDAPAIILGTAAMILRSRKKLVSDPTRRLRLKRATNTYPDTAAACPELSQAAGATDNVVIAVHGTMGCALPLADSLHSILKDLYPSPRILRYEHDTWLPLGTNADELIKLIDSLNTENVTLVAHSRGGLVAAECAQARPHVRSITLGTPYFGTPLLSVADVALPGLRTLMGALRAASGTLMVDPATYLAGFFLRELPQGLATMRDDSDMSSMRRRHQWSPVTAAIAGLAPSDGQAESTAIHFLEKLSSTGLMDDHDLVVPAESARGNAADRTTVASDHFSYMTVPEVHQKIVHLVMEDR